MLVEEIREKMQMPDDVEVELSGHTLKVKGPLGTNERTFKYPNVRLESKNDSIALIVDYPRKVDKAALFTIKSHIKNMIVGVERGYTYKMKIVYAHFPLTVKVNGDNVIIDNYLGEKYPRNAKIVRETKVTVSGDEITVKGINKEHVGQTVGNLEQATRVNKRDPRVFQDGIYLIERDGVGLRW